MKYTMLFKFLITMGFISTWTDIFSQNIILPILQSGDSIIIISSVTINAGTTTISKQHTISGTNFSNVLSNDPKTPAANDPTVTIVLDVVPVTLSAVRAFLRNPGVQIEWKTEQEYNMNRYEVERSDNGWDFVSIGIESSKGNSAIPVDYSFQDGHPINGINYYRIKSIENTGDIKYSRIVNIHFMIKGLVLTCYPNPLVEGKLTLLVANLIKGVYEINITDAAGRKVFATTLNHAGGAVNRSIFLPHAIPAGIYQVGLVGHGARMTSQLVRY